MKEKTKKEKQGHARLFELAGARKNKLTLACLLSVLSSAARIGAVDKVSHNPRGML